jgi:hypothetical protein
MDRIEKAARLAEYVTDSMDMSDIYSYVYHSLAEAYEAMDKKEFDELYEEYYED